MTLRNPPHAMRQKLIVLNEFSLPSVLWDVVRGRQPSMVFSVMPLLPFLAGPMAALRSLCEKRGWLVDAGARFSDLKSADGSEIGLAIATVYPRCETEVTRHFRLNELADKIGPRYGQAYRHAAMGFLKSRMRTLLALKDAEDELTAAGATVHGIHPELVSLFAAIHGRQPRFPCATIPEFRSLTNVMIAMACMGAVIVAAVGAVVRWLSHGPRSDRSSVLGYDQPDADASGGASRLALDIAGPDGALFVFRNQAAANAKTAGAWNDRATAAPNDGILAPDAAMKVLVNACADVVRLMTALCTIHPYLFFAMVKLPVKRVEIRAFLTRYPVRAFLARDDYNTEHVIRSQELRRIGAVSMGISHGMPTAPIKMMHWQYLDFDRYFTFGSFPYETIYRPTWAAGMVQRAIGSWGMTNDQRRRLTGTRSSDIIYFANPLSDPLQLVRAAVAVAAAFPDRLVWAKIKADYRDADPRFQRYLRRAAHRLANFRPTYENPYELMLRCRYAISGLTTAVAEAAQFGCVSLFLDFYEKDIDVLFRHFPEICVPSAAAAIERIKSIEAGEWVYPRDRLEPLIAMHCADPFNAIALEIPGIDLPRRYLAAPVLAGTSS